MYYIKRLFYLVLLLLFTNVTTAQINIPFTTEKTFNSEDQKLGGECVLISSKLNIDGQISMKTFEIEVPADGEYYLSAWVMNTGIIQKNNGLKFYIDDQKTPAGVLKPQKEGWQCPKLHDNNNAKTKKLKLTSGIHYLTFCSTVPEVPPVDFIKLAAKESESEISETKWVNYIEAAKKNVLPAGYAVLKSDSLNNFKLTKVLPNPEGDYLHQIDINFTYTYYATMYFYAGANVVLETKKADPYASDPVMHFFNADDPINRGSWGDDDGGQGYQAKITCTVQYTGYYYVLVRSFLPYSSETTDLYLYDNLYASDIAVAGTGFRCDHTLTEEINYFTSFLSGDSRLWVESYETGYNGRILGYNDDYYGSGDFSWGLNARVKKSYPQRMWNCFVSRYSSNNPTGTCDLYMRCKNSNIMSYFPNLKADDAIMSAPEAYYPDGYNCISWSGGITRYWEWPLNFGSDYFVLGDPLASFDNYYRNYPVTRDVRPNDSSWNYYRSGATFSNNQIDLWSLNGSYTHASVTARWSDLALGNPANDNPHGYDWESKPGGLMRTFHPRNSLSGSSYGNIDKYYRSDGTYVLLSLGKRIAKEDAVFSENEKKKLDSLLEKISDNIKTKFNTKYDVWKETWTNPKISIHSDPRKYAESEEYYEFLDYCKKEGNIVLPLVIQKFNYGDFFVINTIEDLTYKDDAELMNEVKNENKKSGVSRSLKDNWMRYTKKLLSKTDKLWGQISVSPDQQTFSSIPNEFILDKNYPNPFNPITHIQYGLPSKSLITIRIFDILGREVKILVNNELQEKGWHTITWDGRDNQGNLLASGIYICQMIAEKTIQSIKITFMK